MCHRKMRSLTSANTIALPRSGVGRHGSPVGLIGSAAPMEEVAGAQDTIYLCNFRVSVDGEWLCLKELQDLDLQDAVTTQQQQQNQQQQAVDDCGGMGGVAVVGGNQHNVGGGGGNGSSGGGGIVVNYGISSVLGCSENIERSNWSHYCRWLLDSLMVLFALMFVPVQFCVVQRKRDSLTYLYFGNHFFLKYIIVCSAHIFSSFINVILPIFLIELYIEPNILFG